MERRGISYIDDISLVTSSKSIKNNCKILKEAALRIFQKEADNLIQFDPEKTELIHFHSERNTNGNENIYFSEDYLVEAKSNIK